MNRIFLTTAVLLVALFALASCGDKDDHNEGGHDDGHSHSAEDGHDHADGHDHSDGDAHDHGAEKGSTDLAALTKAGIVNTKCPIMGDPVSTAYTTMHMGKKIGFCCEDCLPKWKALSDADKMKKLAK